MGKNTGIEWADHTFNPWAGCSRVSDGCDHCYAANWAVRTGQAALWEGERRRTSERNWLEPLQWERQAEAAGAMPVVFAPSLADPFDNQVPPEWRQDFWQLVDRTPHLFWLLLTKRAGNMAAMLPEWRGSAPSWGDGWPHVGLGVTAENQAELSRRMPLLAGVPTRLRYLSVEPMLGPLDLTGALDLQRNGIGWVICGGESGAHARPIDPDWVRSLRDQCVAAGVPFFFKQWGEWLPGRVFSVGDRGGFVSHQDGTENTHGGKPDHWWRGGAFDGVISTRVGRRLAGAMLDGREWRERPQALTRCRRP